MADPFTEELRKGDLHFWATRGVAIQAYAMLEQGLFRMFCGLTGMDMMTAGTMFFRINNTAARDLILEELFRKKFGSQFNLFRNSLFKLLRPIHLDRNQVVHWHALLEIYESRSSGETYTKTVLNRPQYWDRTAEEKSWDSDRMDEFSAKCYFFYSVCNMFSVIMLPSATTAHNVPLELQSAWQDIFQKPIVYPPPADHPIYRMQPVLDTRPPPSQV